MTNGVEERIEIKIRPEPVRRVVAITGLPGAGKTTLAEGLAADRSWTIVSTGDIARRIDPASLAAGGMADEVAFQKAFRSSMELVDWSKPVILDGIPRSRGQLLLLPFATKIIALMVRPDIAKARLLARGRPDDIEEIIDRRLAEQIESLDVQHADGWLYATVGWGACANTSYRDAATILSDVGAYLDGNKREAF